MSNFLHNAESFLTDLDVMCIIDPPFVHFAERRISFHLIPLKPCEDPFYFQNLSISYEKQGIQLIHLWEDVWNQQGPLVKARIRAFIGDFTSIFARNTEVQRIDKKVIDDFLSQNHLQSTTHAKYKYGLYHCNTLVAAASFSAHRQMQREGKPSRSHELVRFANLSQHTVVGGMSKLLNMFMNEVCPGDIMSYADRDWSTGRSYEKLGFTFIQDTTPQAFLIHPDEQTRYYPHRLPQNITTESLVNKGYITIYNAGNKKYVYLPVNKERA